MERCRIIFSGAGGQGVITASVILAEAAVIYEGLNAVQIQAYGPEARGGATRADVIIDNKEIRYPKVDHPNILICLTQEAYNKYSGMIRPGGLLLTDKKFVKQERKVDAHQMELDMYSMVMGEIGKEVVFNICVLGVIIHLRRLVKVESIEKVLEDKIPQGFLAMNKEALLLGMKIAKEAD